MISKLDLDKAIEYYTYHTYDAFHTKYKDLVLQCSKLLMFLGLPIHSFSDLTIMEMTEFLMDKEKFNSLRIKLNNKVFW